MGAGSLMGAAALAMLAEGPVVMPGPGMGGGPILHIEALGEVPADRAKLAAMVDEAGATQAEADAKLAAKKADVAGKLAALGVGAADLSWEAQPSSHVRTAGMAARQAAMMAMLAAKRAARRAGDTAGTPANPATADPAQSPPAPVLGAAARVTITLRDPVKLVEVSELLNTVRQDDGEFDVVTMPPAFFASDPTAARTRAVALAFANARAEAETYAAALHLHLGRVLRVANSKPALNLPDVVATFQRISPGNGQNPAAMAQTTAAVAIDYQLEP